MAQINHWKTFYKCDLNGYTLVIPSVAIGNVGQLACDLVVSSLSMKKLALVYSPALIPMAGYDPYKLASTKVSGCCEAYICETRKLIILLLRAPLVYKYAETFLTEVVQKFKAENVRDIVVLTSCFAHEKRHIMTSPFRYIVSESSPYIDKLKSLEWVEHEPKEDSHISGGGFASLLYSIIIKESVPGLVIYKFTSEGDNIPDAYEMAKYLNDVVPLFDGPDFYSKLVNPVSWNLLFGRPPPSGIY